MDNKNDEVFVDEGIRSGTIVSDVSQNVQEGFLSYAMSVIVSRALPDVRDGFKPVQRRIIFAMDEDGYTSDKPHVKCAKITGNVMGKYHPHGDSSIYEALVRMAQDFSMRYPLIDGHGNFGNLDGDGAAAARYTEARLSKLASCLVKDIDENTVDFVDNYDGTEKEPTVLPARFPNLLVNGSSGIAVGMATAIPTHNLGEVCDAIEVYAKNPDVDVIELMNYIKGPDFPTGGVILGRSGIRKLYETGRGKIVVRGVAKVIKNDSGRNEIIISEIPYEVNKADLVRKIGQLADDKVIEGISDVKDETSYKTGMRIIVELSKEAVPEVVLNQLYKNTQLQSAFNGNVVALVNGAPRTLTLKDLLKGYLDFQIEIITRRSNFRLNKAKARDHILEGLIIASDDIENVVKLIKNSEDPNKDLKAKYNLDDLQADAILAMTLRKLSKIESNKLLEERTSIEENIKELIRILSSKENIIEVVLKELNEIKQKYADPRRTEISGEEVDDIEDEDLIKKEDIVITLTATGYVKRMSLDEFRAQNRGGKGYKGMTTHEDDVVEKVVYASTHIDILFFTSLGRVYRLRGHRIPEGTRVSKGIPVGNILDLDENEKVLTILPVETYSEDKFLLFATKRGIVKRTELKQFELIRQNGKYAITLKEGDELIGVKETDGSCLVALAASNGKMAVFKENEIRSMGRTASGVKGISLSSKDRVLSLGVSCEGTYILVLTSKGYGKLSSFDEYRQTHRGSKGVKTLQTTAKNGNLVSMRVVVGDEDLLVFTKAGIMIRTHLNQLRITHRSAVGVRVINIADNQSVSTVAVVPPEINEESEESATIEAGDTTDAQ